MWRPLCRPVCRRRARTGWLGPPTTPRQRRRSGTDPWPRPGGGFGKVPTRSTIDQKSLCAPGQRTSPRTGFILTAVGEDKRTPNNIRPPPRALRSPRRCVQSPRRAPPSPVHRGLSGGAERSRRSFQPVPPPVPDVAPHEAELLARKIFVAPALRQAGLREGLGEARFVRCCSPRFVAGRGSCWVLLVAGRGRGKTGVEAKVFGGAWCGGGGAPGGWFWSGG